LTNLIGVYECKVDAKGRLMFPVAFKKQLSNEIKEGFVLKRSVFNKCLELYTYEEWQKELKTINKLNRFIKKNNDFIRMFMAGVNQVELDSNGRLLIPKILVNYANISKDIVLSSMGNRIEIWDKDGYENAINDDNIDFGTLAEEVMGKFLNDEEVK